MHGLHGIGFAGGYRASKDYEVVGGDFYDFHPGATPEDETLVVLGDVCGKGLEAAVMTGKIRNTLQALTPLACSHEGVLTLLNRAMLSADHARFATLVLASVSYRDGEVALRLTSAGHPPPLILRDGGRVEEADTRGTMVGACRASRCRASRPPWRRARRASCTSTGSRRRGVARWARTSSANSAWRTH